MFYFIIIVKIIVKIIGFAVFKSYIYMYFLKIHHYLDNLIKVVNYIKIYNETLLDARHFI